jgi:hypothetical protein
MGAGESPEGVVSPAEVVLGEVALGEDVGLDLIGLRTDKLPINLITVQRHQNNGANNTGAGSGLRLNLNTTEEDILVREDRGPLLRFVKGEESSLTGKVVDVSATGRGEAVAKLLGQVARVLLVTVGGVGGAIWGFMLVRGLLTNQNTRNSNS